jgi:hypothetical protein
VLSQDASVLIVENSDTGASNSPFLPLDLQLAFKNRTKLKIKSGGFNK